MANDRMYLRCAECDDLFYLARRGVEEWTAGSGGDMEADLNAWFDKHWHQCFTGDFRLAYESDPDWGKWKLAEPAERTRIPVVSAARRGEGLIPIDVENGMAFEKELGTARQSHRILHVQGTAMVLIRARRVDPDPKTGRPPPRFADLAVQVLETQGDKYIGPFANEHIQADGDIWVDFGLGGHARVEVLSY